MFPFGGDNELSFQNYNTGEQVHNNINEDLILLENNASSGVGSMNPSRNINKGRGRGRKSLSLATNTSTNDDYEKKIIHREVERQRRQEMSDLYASLSSILPAQYIKGKRSVSHHVEEAVNYIKDLEKNVKEIREKRDQLRKSEEITISRHIEEGGSSSFLPGSVAIHLVVGGLEIEINVSCEDEGFSLATTLQVVSEEGLNVTSYSSININGRLIHKLMCEVRDATSIDVNRLQQRLIDLVC